MIQIIEFYGEGDQKVEKWLNDTLTSLRAKYYDKKETHMRDLNGNFFNKRFRIFFIIKGRASKRFLEKLKAISTSEIREFPDWFKSCRNKARQFLDIIKTSFGMNLHDDPVEYGIEKSFLPAWEVSFLRYGSESLP